MPEMGYSIVRDRQFEECLRYPQRYQVDELPNDHVEVENDAQVVQHDEAGETLGKTSRMKRVSCLLQGRFT